MSCGLRDVMELEALGCPGVLVASGAFAQAAAEQVVLLGAPALNYTLVDHPVQDRTDEELRVMARAALDDVLAAISPAP
ncbi:MAG: hypothetical protein QOG68_2667 [Solirubrobacteraceae bacterium]|nr:hypothetical protein [Solirubrobacteraceae bacterium]